MTIHLDWFDVVYLKALAVGVVAAVALSWKGWGRLVRANAEARQ